MNMSLKSTLLAAGMLMAAMSFAQAPATAPAGSTGLCKDGTYWTNATKSGACRGHKGVKDWYASSKTASAPVAPAAAPATTAATAPAAAAPAASTPATVATKPATKPGAFTPPATPAAGGGAGLVWGNEGSKVYHCSNDRWYGKTKNGKYMSEADAKAAGYRPDHGKACQ